MEEVLPFLLKAAGVGCVQTGQVRPRLLPHEVQIRESEEGKIEREKGQRKGMKCINESLRYLVLQVRQL